MRGWEAADHVLLEQLRWAVATTADPCLTLFGSQGNGTHLSPVASFNALFRLMTRYPVPDSRWVLKVIGGWVGPDVPPRRELMARRRAVNTFMIRCGEVRDTAVIVPYSVFGEKNYLKIVEGKGPAASTNI